ncbi:unnamed protein product [Zymoseptoria tritici ST99CH_1E4]|uniref:DUF726 domain protein n=1 Tax=Zymoseptoria tritici ST99CH_1E4 TaxID=1276532 RepID=A0A2H1GGT2_ZYMTR|nr:unnamed protein product [Zymoseptoria tritici ST99CH_1E4]
MPTVPPQDAEPQQSQTEAQSPQSPEATHTRRPSEAPSVRSLNRVVSREQKHDEPQAEPPVADEFGLPARPPRRRQYTLGELDTPDEIRENVLQEIEEAEGEQGVVKKDEEASAEKKSAPVEQETEANDVAAKDKQPAPAQLHDAADQASKAKEDDESTASPPRSIAKHAQKPSIASVSEFSHQPIPERLSTDDSKPDEEDEWQEMPALATHRIYDDWGKVLAKEYGEVEDETVKYGTLGGAGKGYSRVQMEEDAKSATSLDDHTAYLFKDGYSRNVLVEEDDDDGRDLLSQMQTTKELLTEGQRIAYVGVVRLSLAQMAKQIAELEHTKGTKKELETALEAMRMWSQKIMLRLYNHMEIDAREQIMVEQLADHGVLPEDLTPALMQNARVKNPKMEEEDEASQPGSARQSVSSPLPSRPTSAIGRGSSSNNVSAAPSKPSTPAPVESKPATPAAEDAPPPAYHEHTADELTIQDPDDLQDEKNLDLDVRWTVLCDLFLLLIADSTYDARSRQLLEHVGKALSVEWQDICRFEKRVTDALEMQEQGDKENWNEDEHLDARRKAARNRRLMVMGMCTVGGGLVIGLSAGLLAPVIGAGLAAGFTTIGVAGTGGFLGGTGAAALIGTTGTLIGGKIGLTTSHRRTGAVKTYEYKPLFNNKRVNLIVTVAGWMTGKVDDVRLPFSTIDPVMGDIYSVNWEPEMLQSTGQTIQILGTEALTQTIQQVLGATILTTLMAGLSTPMILAKMSYLIDNPWTVSLARADATGLILADSIIDRNLGVRPITLVGFSLGSRVIFSCLKELARRGAFGLIQNVYMFGSPVVVKKDEYIRARSVVHGRFVNGYATNDWILGYLFRATSGGIMRVAGLASVDVTGIENINVTEHVPGHMAYRAMMPTLLSNAGWAVESLEYTEIEDPDPDNHDKRQRELLNEIEEARRQLDEQPEKKGFKAFFSRKKATQKKVWETYDERNARVLEGDEKAAEQLAQESLAKEANVMFDVDAIRKEALALAIQRPSDIEEIKQHLSVREIKSTMPALKVDLNNSPTSPTNGQWRNSFHGESEASSSGRPSFAQAKSYGGIVSQATAAESKDGKDENVTMEFEDSVPPPPPPFKREANRSFTAPGGGGTWTFSDRGENGSAYQTPLRGQTPDPPRSMASAATATSSPPPLLGNVDHNPWGENEEEVEVDVDDPRFGKERGEVTLTF